MPLNVRNPGALPNVYAHCAEARALLQDQKLDKSVRKAVEALLALASTQHELNKRLWESKKGVPEPHSDSHMGLPGLVDDSISGTSTPSTIRMNGDAGDVGDPTQGYAPIDHTHPTKLFWEVMSITSLGF